MIVGIISKPTRSKSTCVQNPPDFFFFVNLLVYLIKCFLFIFYLFFTNTVTPNSYPRSVGGS